MRLNLVQTWSVHILSYNPSDSFPLTHCMTWKNKTTGSTTYLISEPLKSKIWNVTLNPDLLNKDWTLNKKALSSTRIVGDGKHGSLEVGITTWDACYTTGNLAGQPQTWRHQPAWNLRNTFQRNGEIQFACVEKYICRDIQLSISNNALFHTLGGQNQTSPYTFDKIILLRLKGNISTEEEDKSKYS